MPYEWHFPLPQNAQYLKKKCVSIDSNCSEMHRNAKKNFFTRLIYYALLRVAQSPSGEAQLYQR